MFTPVLDCIYLVAWYSCEYDRHLNFSWLRYTWTFDESTVVKFRKYWARIVLTLEGWLTVCHCQKLYLECIIIVYINRDQKIAHGKKMWQQLDPSNNRELLISAHYCVGNALLHPYKISTLGISIDQLLHWHSPPQSLFQNHLYTVISFRYIWKDAFPAITRWRVLFRVFHVQTEWTHLMPT